MALKTKIVSKTISAPKLKIAVAFLFLGGAALAASSAGMMASAATQTCVNTSKVVAYLDIKLKGFEFCNKQTVVLLGVSDKQVKEEVVSVKGFNNSQFIFLHAKTGTTVILPRNITKEFTVGATNATYEALYRGVDSKGRAYVYLRLKKIDSKLVCNVTADCVADNMLTGYCYEGLCGKSQCVDSDATAPVSFIGGDSVAKGDNPNQAGSVLGHWGCPEEKQPVQSFKDYCVSETEVFEYMCNGGCDNVLAHAVKCGDGTSCVQGACVPSTTP